MKNGFTTIHDSGGIKALLHPGTDKTPCRFTLNWNISIDSHETFSGEQTFSSFFEMLIYMWRVDDDVRFFIETHKQFTWEQRSIKLATQRDRMEAFRQDSEKFGLAEINKKKPPDGPGDPGGTDSPG